VIVRVIMNPWVAWAINQVLVISNWTFARLFWQFGVIDVERKN